MSWINALNDIVTSHWSATGKAFLLSNTKSAIQSRGIDLTDSLAGRKLKDAVQEDGVGRLRLVRNPSQPLVWGLIPGSVDAPSEMQDLFRVRDKIVEGDRMNSPRFGRGIWLAFAKPVKGGCRRFLDIGPPSRFVDVPEDGMPPATGLEVTPAYLPNQSDTFLPPSDHDSEVEKNIRAWAASRGIDIEKLTVSARNPTSVHRFEKQNDILDFSDLTASEKSRILIPLDLISKIKFGWI